MHISDSIRAFAALLYDDTANVERSTPTVLPNGSTVMRYAVVKQDLPCRLSRVAGRRDDVDIGLPQTQTDSEARLFCDPEHDVRSGDRVSVFRDGRADLVRQYIAGEPFHYPSHTEIPLLRPSEA